MNETSYKMRAECMEDFCRFLSRVHAISFKVEKLGSFFDIVATFTTNLSLDEIKQKISTIPDGHVMLETITFESEYTGERKQP